MTIEGGEMTEKSMIDAEEMIDKARDASELTNRIHRVGKSVGRTELDQADQASA